MFAGDERSRAARMLVERCGETLPMTGRATADFWDRIRFAVLKLSGGDLRKCTVRSKVRITTGVTPWSRLDSAVTRRLTGGGFPSRDRETRGGSGNGDGDLAPQRLPGEGRSGGRATGSQIVQGPQAPGT